MVKFQRQEPMSPPPPPFRIIRQVHLLAGECDDAEDIKDKIVDVMTVPLVQGLLRWVLCLVLCCVSVRVVGCSSLAFRGVLRQCCAVPWRENLVRNTDG